ncbi:MAG: hypothetical protein WCJ25_01270 [Candidatus Moraniibacteriota bacterium]
MGTIGDIMDGITPLPEPSQSIIDALESRRVLSYETTAQVVEQWEKLLGRISICRGSLTLHQNGQGAMTRKGDLLEIHMDVDPLGNSDEEGFMYASFSKGGTARIATFCGDVVDEKRLESFLGFEGTWEEVTRKIIELNDLVVAENTPPPVPDDLQEE